MSTSPFLPADDPRAGSCGSCGAPMAADQRYCLSCGARRQHARLPFQDALVPAGPQGGPPSGVVQPALWAPPSSSGPATSTLLAALACVLIAFGVGVLVGNDGGGGSQQPIVVGGAPTAAAAAPTPTTTQTTAATTTDDTSASTDASSKATSKIDKSKLDATQKKEAAEIEKTPATTPKAVTLPKSTANDLHSKNTDKARDASRSLPDAVAVGGG